MSTKISNLPEVISANVLETDLIPLVANNVTSKVKVSELRNKLGTTPPAGGRTVTSALQYLNNNAVYNVKDFGAFGDGATDDRAAINTAKTAADAAGYSLYFPPGTYKVATDLTIGKSVFAPGAVISISTTKILTVTGAIIAGRHQIFLCNGTATVAPSAGALHEIYVEWFGATGDGSTDDTTTIGKALNASATAISLSTPTNGTQVAEHPVVYFDGKEYVISGAYSMGAYHTLRSRTKARLRQTDSTLVHFNFGNSHRVMVEGIQFIGGKHAIWYWNNNTELGRLTIRDCSFQLTSNFAIRVGGSGDAGGGGAKLSSIATLAATATGFTRASGSFLTDGFAAGMTLTPSGFSDNMISVISSVAGDGLSITVADARLVEASAGGRGLEGTYSQDTRSSNVLVENCEFYYNAGIISSTADQTTLKDIWVSIKNSIAANSPQIVNLGFAMSIDQLFGVPPGTATPAALRWIDNYSRVWIKDSRFGGENGGIPVVWHRGAPSASSSDAQGTVVSIKGGYASGGAANPTSGLIIFRENIPELIEIRGVRGLGTTGVIIEGPASVYANNITTSTYLAAYGAALHARFRARVDGNLMSSPTAVPAAYKEILLRRYDQILTEPLMTGTVALVDNVAKALIDVSLDSGGGNDDAVSIMVEYEIEDSAAGANRSIETGSVAFVAARNTSPASIGAVSKIGFAQIMSGGITMTVTFTAVVVSNVVTLKVTNDTSNGDGSTITFRARQMKPPSRGGTTVALASGVAWAQAGA